MIKIFELKNIISIKDLNKSDIDYIIDEASKLEDIAKSREISEELKGKILGLMFFEPSTRTKMSFETSMKRLSGECIGFENTGSSSVSKGESIADTAKMFEGYCDALVIRHEMEGVSKFISDIVDVPVINAGDGAGQHPTQTLLDLYTIKKEIGHIDNIKIALIGDLKYGRTVHSLVQAMCNFKAKFNFVSPVELKMPSTVIQYIKNAGLEYHEYTDLESVIPNSDIIYMTRVQRERFPDPLEYEKVKNSYVLRNDMLENSRPNCRILHPLPRVNEIHTDVDSNPKAYYFQQAQNGLYVRQALIAAILGLK